MVPSDEENNDDVLTEGDFAVLEGRGDEEFDTEHKRAENEEGFDCSTADLKELEDHYAKMVHTNFTRRVSSLQDFQRKFTEQYADGAGDSEIGKKAFNNLTRRYDKLCKDVKLAQVLHPEMREALSDFSVDLLNMRE